MIIVEGPDGAGKSTLVRRLSDDLSLSIGERGVANRDELWKSTREDTYRALSGCLHGPAQIWDRLYFSEGIYSAIMKRKNQFTQEDTRVIVHLISFLQVPFVLCLPPWSTVEGNVRGSHQMEGVERHLRLIYKWYEELFEANKPEDEKKGAASYLKAIKYDYTTDDYEYILRRCRIYLNERGER